MDMLTFRNRRIPPYLFVLFFVLAYLAVFAIFYPWAGIGIASLAIIPVMAASWSFGTTAGVLTGILLVSANTLILMYEKRPFVSLYLDPGNLIGSFSLIVTAIVIGRFARVAEERKAAVLTLEQYEQDREAHTRFLEVLNHITVRALAADSLDATLNILVAEIARLFQADDVFFNFWDDLKHVPVPITAYGSMSDIYPIVQIEPGEITPTASVMQAQKPLTLPDLDNSPYISPRIAAIFPSQSMLAIPLIAQQRKLGALLLGYNQKHTFERVDVVQAGIVSEQVSLVLSKSQLLEEERKQVRQLTALHDVAVVSVEADDQDQLIEQVTQIIGQNLYPDNFGILLMDEERQVLRAHPSYRFHSTDRREIRDVHLGEGISGEVARTGQPRREGNVRRLQNYLDMDDRTVSELCVPIKFKEQVLGVINAESTRRDAFTADDERLLATLAGQMATAMEQLRKAQAERKWLDQLAHSNDLIYSIARITTQIERSLTENEIIQTLGEQLEKLGLTCIMAAYDTSAQLFNVNYTSLPPDQLATIEAGLGYPLLHYSFGRDKFKSLAKDTDLLRPAVISNPAEEIKVLFTNINPDGISAILQKIGVVAGLEPIRLPLAFEERLRGMLWVWGSAITPSDLPILSIFAKQVGISLERARLFQEVQSLALTDPLTGLQNRRSIFELGRIEFSRAQRMNRPFSCMMLDLDHFKVINDKYGHPTGDMVLREFALRCQRSVRDVDLVGRYGGEELIILLPETDRDTAVKVAERLRISVAEMTFERPGGRIPLTVSIGVATEDSHTTHLDALIARADQALYIAKHRGRNRVAISR